MNIEINKLIHKDKKPIMIDQQHPLIDINYIKKYDRDILQIDRKCIM